MAQLNIPSLVKYNPLPLSDFDDGTVMKNIKESHKPDGRMFLVKSVMRVVEQTFCQASIVVQV